MPQKTINFYTHWLEYLIFGKKEEARTSNNITTSYELDEDGNVERTMYTVTISHPKYQRGLPKMTLQELNNYLIGNLK